MGRMYTVVAKAIAVTAAQDFLEILAATGKGTYIHEWTVSQSTETGDAAEEGLLLTCNRGVGAVTSGSGGGSVTAQPIMDADTAYGGTIERNNTTIMAVGSGTLEELEAYIWNVRVPFQKIYTPETRPYISPGNRWTLELETAPADSVTITVTAIIEEHG